MDKDLQSAEVKELCQTVAKCLHECGILIIKDPRAKHQDNSTYIDLMETYFESRGRMVEQGLKLQDERPEYHYQVGICPKYTEIAREHTRVIQNLSEENSAMSPLVPVLDAKWRFMWKVGERPADANDNFPQVIPEDFPDWTDKMDTWGNKLLNAVETVAEMAAIGMGIERDTFTSKMDGGAHLLAPTGSDLAKNEVGTVFAGFHYDIAFLTIHGKSRFPGLYIWTRNKQRMQVKVPEGCLLL